MQLLNRPSELRSGEPCLAANLSRLRVSDQREGERYIVLDRDFRFDCAVPAHRRGGQKLRLRATPLCGDSYSVARPIVVRIERREARLFWQSRRIRSL